jgi:hypothetical protein
MYSITQAPKNVSGSMPHKHAPEADKRYNGSDGKNTREGFGLPTASGQYPHAVSQDGKDSGSVHGGYGHGMGQGAC